MPAFRHYGPSGQTMQNSHVTLRLVCDMQVQGRAMANSFARPRSRGPYCSTAAPLTIFRFSSPERPIRSPLGKVRKQPATQDLLCRTGFSTTSLSLPSSTILRTTASPSALAMVAAAAASGAARVAATGKRTKANGPKADCHGASGCFHPSCAWPDLSPAFLRMV